ncbi:putative dolichyl-phosphate-mannose--protein mannosyltransferase LALA0_S12e01750g [Lachancea lanzarotensis]|uniref:dolichyl-phosphate-mannose--protein mannosyltransferase n=1 Tax=Lachancea lanzarotensis TaxID=1245769 RepID=A0A0C7NE17_9SACH|nr:uncharacterized protein LALA0_S12e01750g [Lachancea lanzarotensis]CEP64562.1 LALA0S12e01750g1_1 [Lachancea lanzarotensis]
MSKNAQKREVDLNRGPDRPFLGIEIYEKFFAVKLKGSDYALAVLLAFSFVLRQLRKGGLEQESRSSELDLLEAARHYNSGNFHINSFPPMIVQVLALSLKFTENLSLETLRKINLVVAGITVATFYLTLRASSVVSSVAVAATAVISNLPLFVEESTHLSAEIPQLSFLTCGLLSWNIFKRSRLGGKKWYFSLLLLAGSIVGGIGTKFLGLVTWAWFLLLLFKRAWETIGDVNIDTVRLFKFISFGTATIISLPLATFVLSYFVFLSNSRMPSLDHSSMVSPYFENWFLPQPMPQPDVVYYGSNILIRHAQSIGGYLHSHNYTYPAGSGGQQVSLFLHSNDGDNEWIVEPYSEDLAYREQLEPVRNGALIKLRHKNTGKLLRASSAKPPISEQDYDSEVSCTGDWEYKGDADESWRIRFERGKPAHHDLLCPYTILFSLENKGHECKLLSHDLRLPEWGFGQQEVLCVDPADKARSLFFVDRSNLYKERGAYLPRPTDWIGTKLWKVTTEYVQLQYKFDYYLKNNDLISDIKMDSWLWSPKGSHISSKLMWFAPLACLTIYLIVEIARWARWNPWADPATELDTVKFLYLDVCCELAIGWFMHYHVFTWCEHENLDPAQYLPSYLLSMVLAAATANFFWQHSKTSRVVLIVYASSVVIATYIWA